MSNRPNISYPTPIYNTPGPSNFEYHPQAAYQAHPYAASAQGQQGHAQAQAHVQGQQGYHDGASVRRSSMQSSHGGGRQAGPGGPRPGPSALDSSITRLLVVTKQLLQALDQWAQGYLNENDVSDVYVRLGDIFENCVAAFNRAGIPTRELNAIPNDLRLCLEQALAEDASQESLNIYLPTIRQIIYNLLDGLKRKQAQYKRSLEERAEAGSARDAHAHGLHAPGHIGAGLAHSQSHGQLLGSGSGSGPSSTGAGAGVGGPGSVSRRPVPPPVINEDDRLSVSGRSIASVNSMGSAQSAAPAPAPVSAAMGRVSPRNDSLGKVPSSSALAERERERAQRAGAGQTQRPAPPDAFRPPRRVPSDGQPMRTSPSPKPPYAPLPEGQSHAQAQNRGVQLKDDGPVPSPPPGGAFHSNPASREPAPLIIPMPVPVPAQNPSPGAGAGAPAPPPKAASRDRYSRERDSFGNPKPISRFSADSDITNGSPIKSPPSRSPPATIRTLTESDEDTSFAASLGANTSASESKTSFSALSDAPSLPKLELPSTSLLEPDLMGEMSAPTTPPPPSDLAPESKSTLAALRQMEPLERRASKRFSSYTFNKMVPASPGSGAKGRKPSGLGVLGLGLGSSTGSGSASASASALGSSGNDSPQRPARRVDKAPPMPPLPEGLRDALHPDRARATSPARSEGEGEDAESGTGERTPERDGPTPRASPSAPSGRSGRSAVTMIETSYVDPTEMGGESAAEAEDGRRGQATSVGVFLQLGRQVKKTTLDLPIALSALRLLFMEKFEYNPELDDFPEVYVNDRRTGVSFELEDMEDVREGCVLSLNIEPLDQVKQHFDHTFSTLVAEIKEMKSSLDHSRRISTNQGLLSVSPSVPARNTTSPTATLASPVLRASPRLAPVPSIPSIPSPLIDASRRKELEAQADEIQSLRRDLAVMRQLQQDFLSDTKTAFSHLRQQNNAMKDVIKTKTGGSRALLDNSKARLDAASSETIAAVEEVQDIIDYARDDAQRRYVVPSAVQLRKIRADLQRATELADGFARDVVAMEPTWRATWGYELSRVMEEQKLLAHQTKLGQDLRNDVRDAREVWENVEVFVKQRSAQLAQSAGAAGGGGGGGGVAGDGGQGGIGAMQVVLRTPGKAFRPPSPDPDGGGIPNLLMEIRSKEAADPTQRLKAIEAQARARERERGQQKREDSEFADELEGFVVGRKLKKTGGHEEVERMRMRKQEVVLRRMMGAGAGAGAGSAGSGGVSPVSVTSGASTPVLIPGTPIKLESEVKRERQETPRTAASATASGAGSGSASARVKEESASPALTLPGTSGHGDGVATAATAAAAEVAGSDTPSTPASTTSASGEGGAGAGAVAVGAAAEVEVERAGTPDKPALDSARGSTASTASFGSAGG